MYSSYKLLILTLLLTGQVHAGMIFGGKEAKPHSRPYMALVEMTDWTANEIKRCGGFLLSEEFVMTAAHCNANDYKVHLGVHNVHKEENTQTIYVNQMFIGKDYDPATLTNDFLLLKLSSKAKITDYVKPIILAGPEDATPKSCSLSGWGRSDEYPSNLTPVLMEVNVTLSDEDPCTKDDFYCCKGIKRSGRGDSGGPLVCENGKAYGVVSHSLFEDGKPIAHYFAKIPNNKDWIESTMKNNTLL